MLEAEMLFSELHGVLLPNDIHALQNVLHVNKTVEEVVNNFAKNPALSYFMTYWV